MLVAWVAGTWFGLSGVGAVLVGATRWCRHQQVGGVRQLSVAAAELERIWVSPYAVWLRAAEQTHWICRDEVSTAVWAGLLRWLYRHVPSQAVGFNISK